MTGRDLVELDREGSVAVVALNDPGRRNALHSALRDRLIDVVSEVRDDPQVRAIVLTGRGAVFCAGGDRSTMPPPDDDASRRRMSQLARLIRVVHGSAKPVVAAVHGAAVGAGVGLACCADVVVAGAATRFLLPFVDLGLLPDAGLLHLLPDRVGVATARRLLLDGGELSGASALALGLVDELVDDETDVLARGVERARALTARSAETIALVKEAFRDGPLPLADALERERTLQPGLFRSMTTGRA